MSEVSFFYKNIKNTKPDKTISIDDFLNFVKYGEFKQLQLEIASISDKKKRSIRKAEILPYATLSGVFNSRKTSGLLKHSGFIAIDFDNVEDFESTRSTLIKDTYSYSVFKSVSGLGFCVLVKISNDANKHLSHYNWLARYYYEQYGLVIDEHCKDVPRPRFVSYDPDLIINDKSKKAGVKQEKKTKAKRIQFTATNSQMDRIVSEISSRGLNITESYDDYLRVGMAIACEYNESGRSYFHAVASCSGKYNQKECDKKYNNCLKSSQKVSIGTFFYLAAQAGVEIHNKDEKQAYQIAQAARRSNLTAAGALKTAITIRNIPEKIAKETIDAVFKSKTTEIYNKDDDTPVIEQITDFLDLNHTFKKNEVTRVIEDEKGRELDDQFENTIYIKAKALIGNKVNKHDIECVINSDRTTIFNPFKEFYQKHSTLPHRPEVISEFINGLTSTTPNFDYWVRKWLLGLPASIHGETVRLVLVLCGKQNNGKTFWFRMLMPQELKRYYAESKLDRGKDDEILMTQNLIVMNDEYGGLTVKSAEKFKDLISKDIFTLREPYGRRNVHLKRLALIAGTSNDSAIISDYTGNSRIIPINISEVNFAINESIDRTQLFIEIWRAYERGESWKLTKDDLINLDKVSANHETIRIEQELLEFYFEPGSEFYSLTRIKEYLEKVSYLKTNNTILGIEVKKLFSQVTLNGKKGYRLAKMNDGIHTPHPLEVPF